MSLEKTQAAQGPFYWKRTSTAIFHRLPIPTGEMTLYNPRPRAPEAAHGVGPRSPSGGIGRRSGLRPNNLSPRGEIHEVKPVKVGEGPGQLAVRANAEPSPGENPGRCREQTAGT
jgi:hypothetical protein